MTYVSPSTKGFYLLRDALVQLGVISIDFPKVGDECNNRKRATGTMQLPREINASSSTFHLTFPMLRRKQPEDLRMANREILYVNFQ